MHFKPLTLIINDNPYRAKIDRNLQIQVFKQRIGTLFQPPNIAPENSPTVIGA